MNERTNLNGKSATVARAWSQDEVEMGVEKDWKEGTTTEEIIIP